MAVAFLLIFPPWSSRQIENFSDHTEETWCHWSELKPFLTPNESDNDWHHFLHIFSFLSHTYGDQHVRFVLWTHYNLG